MESTQSSAILLININVFLLRSFPPPRRYEAISKRRTLFKASIWRATDISFVLNFRQVKSSVIFSTRSPEQFRYFMV